MGGSAAPTTLLTYSGPTSNDGVSLAFKQHIGATDALRTGSYSKTLTFTLSTTAPVRRIGPTAPAVGRSPRPTTEEGEMIEPYQAIGLVPTMWGIRKREDIFKNLQHLDSLCTASAWLGGLDLPVRLVAMPEGALQGFNDEVLDLDHETFARECAIDIPGPETDELGRLARKWKAFVMAQAKARHPEFPGRYFNVGFVLNPDGEVVLKHHKLVPLLPVEHSMTPFNVYDRWVELYGETLDAFYPVADTEIGRLGIMMANEGSLSRERARAGDERRRGGLPRLVPASLERRLRGADPRPRARQQLLRDRAERRHLLPVRRRRDADRHLRRALADRRLPRAAWSASTRTRAPRHGSAGIVDIGALRHFRAHSKWGNWMKDLTTEQYRLIYDQPVYPKNLYADHAPYKHAEYQREVIEPQIQLLRDRGIY